MNPIECYTDAGRKAGKAARRRDMATVTFHVSWCNRAVDLEPQERKDECREAFRKAYKEEAAP